MAYATIPDVQRLMAQFVIGTSSKPTNAEVDSVITDIDHEVNVVLESRGIDIPVTTPSTFVGWLGMVVSYGACAAVLKSMFPASQGPGENPAYAFWESRYKAALKGIMDGKLIPSTVPQSTKAKPATYFTRNPDQEEDLGDIAEPSFKVGKNF